MRSSDLNSLMIVALFVTGLAAMAMSGALIFGDADLLRYVIYAIVAAFTTGAIALIKRLPPLR